MAEMDACFYHRSKPASWHCPHCERDIGECCAPKPPGTHRHEPDCPSCQQRLTYLGHHNTVAPFWHDVNRFFAYPFESAPIIFLAALSFLGVMIPLIEFFTWPLIILIISIGLKYLYHIIEKTSQGNMSPPDLTEAFSGSGLGIFFHQITVFFCAGLLYSFSIQSGSQFLAISAQTFITLALPASIMILAKEGAITSALNPILLTKVIIQIGLPYLILFAFMMTLSAGPQYLLPILYDAMNPAAVAPLAIFISGYFYCVIFAMIGYCLHQFEHALDFDSELDFSSENIDEDEYQNKRVIAQAEVHIREGRFIEACKVVKHRVTAQKENQTLDLHYQKLLVATKNNHELREHTPTLVNQLCANGYFDEATNVYQDAFRVNFAPLIESPQHNHKLAEILIKRGLGKESTALLKGFHIRFPNYIGLADVYFLASKAYAEILHQGKPALKLLDYILKKFPDHSSSSEWLSYRKVVCKMELS